MERQVGAREDLSLFSPVDSHIALDFSMETENLRKAERGSLFYRNYARGVPSKRIKEKFE
jgi:hypothetical protein